MAENVEFYVKLRVNQSTYNAIDFTLAQLKETSKKQDPKVSDLLKAAKVALPGKLGSIDLDEVSLKLPAETTRSQSGLPEEHFATVDDDDTSIDVGCPISVIIEAGLGSISKKPLIIELLNRQDVPALELKRPMHDPSIALPISEITPLQDTTFQLLKKEIDELKRRNDELERRNRLLFLQSMSSIEVFDEFITTASILDSPEDWLFLSDLPVGHDIASIYNKVLTWRSQHHDNHGISKNEADVQLFFDNTMPRLIEELNISTKISYSKESNNSLQFPRYRPDMIILPFGITKVSWYVIVVVMERRFGKKYKEGMGDIVRYLKNLLLKQNRDRGTAFYTNGDDEASYVYIDLREGKQNFYSSALHFLNSRNYTSGFELLIRILISASVDNLGFNYRKSEKIDNIDFDLISLLGFGSSSRVYEINHKDYGKCALKIPLGQDSFLTDERKNIEYVKKLMGKVDYIIDCHKIDGLEHALVLSPVGVNLKEFYQILTDKSPNIDLISKPFTPLQMLTKLILQLLNAIWDLHEKGIHHGDIRPSNVIVWKGQVKIIDWEGVSFGDSGFPSKWCDLFKPDCLLGSIDLDSRNHGIREELEMLTYSTFWVQCESDKVPWSGMLADPMKKKRAEILQRKGEEVFIGRELYSIFQEEKDSTNKIVYQRMKDRLKEMVPKTTKMQALGEFFKNLVVHNK